MRQLYKNIYRSLLLAGLFAGGVFCLPGCSSFEDGMIGSFPFLEINTTDTTVSNTAQNVQIPVNTNREWTVSVEYLYEDEFSNNWVYASPSADYKILNVNLKENTSEHSRTALITVNAVNGTVYASFSIFQEASSERTYSGNLIIRTQEELNNIAYTRVSGALVIGNLYSDANLPGTKASSGPVNINIDGSGLVAGPSNITDLSALVKIKSIGRKSFFLLNTKVKKLPGFLKNYGLERIHADYNQLENLDSIVQMPALQHLTLSHNKIKDISPLGSLKNIVSLNLAYNQITDIKPLGKLTRLKNLILGEDGAETNEIVDLSVLNTMANLQKLVLNGLPLDEAQIAKLNLPSNCEVEYNQLKGSPLPLVSTLEPLSPGDGSQLELAGVFQKKEDTGVDITIESCGFYYGTVNDLEQMDYVEGAKQGDNFTARIDVRPGRRYYIYAVVTTDKGKAYGEMQAWGDNIREGNLVIRTSKDIEDFKKNGYTLIEGAIIIGNASAAYSDNAPAVTIDGEKYYFTPSTIDDISFLAGITRVKTGIYIVNTQVSNLAPLVRQVDIARLWLAKNQISEIPDFTLINGLTELSLSGNRIQDIDKLAGITGLRVLHLGDREYPAQETNTIRNIGALYEMSGLQEVDLSGLPLTGQMVDDFRQMFPSCTVYAEGLKTPQSPQVTTGMATEITATSARLNATLVSVGDAAPEEYGFYYGADTNNMQRLVVGGELQVVFDYLLEGLELGKHYYFRAFAANQYGEGRGSLRDFVTAATYTGDVILRNQQEVDNWMSQGYSRIDGALIVGSAGNNWQENTRENIWINNRSYYFKDTDITNLTALQQLTEVTKGIYVIANPLFSDLTPLTGLTNAGAVTLDYNNIQDITPLTRISGITQLSLSCNPVSDWSPLLQMKSLVNLNVTGCNVEDLSVIGELSGLTNLNFSNNVVRDLSPLAALTNLTHLSFLNNQITDLTPLRNMSRLVSLNIASNQVSDLSPVAEIGLTDFHCSNNSISDLSALAKMNLSAFSCARNYISDVSVLRTHTRLYYLYLGEGMNETNTIHDIAVLKDLTNLRTLYLHGLPLTQSQVDEVKSALSQCDIYADFLKEYAPVLDNFTVEVLDNTSLNAVAEITSEGVSAITERGFLYGTENNTDRMTKVTVSGKMTGRYACKLTGLEEATTYYVMAFASNGSAIAYTQSLEIKTEGVPVVNTLRMQGESPVVEGQVTFTGGGITAYGVVWSLEGIPTVNAYEGIFRMQDEVLAGETWTASLEGLRPGYTYQVRCFAENKYGTAYGDVIQYTAPGELAKYNFILDANIPDMQVGETTETIPVENVYAYYFKAGMSDQGKAVAPSAAADKQFTYSLPEGEQSLVFTNLAASGEHFRIQSLESPGRLWSIRQTEGINGLGSDLLVGTGILNLSGNDQGTNDLERKVARLNIAVQAKDAAGALVADLSELIAGVNISLDNFYSGWVVTSDMSGQWEGSITNQVAAVINSTTARQAIAENVYTFPTVAGKKNAVTLRVELKDGRTVRLASQLPLRIEANHGYSLTLTIAGNKGNHSFTLEDIVVEEEIIEF